MIRTYSRKILQSLRFLNALSLDVALGSVAMSILLSRVLGIVVNPWAFLGLGLTVWLIYVLDHLMDVRDLSASPKSYRHRLHYRHFGLLTTVWMFFMITGVILILPELSPEVLICGVGLAGTVLGHLLLVKWEQKNQTWLGKEIRIAIIYTLGVFVPLGWDMLLSAKGLIMFLLLSALATLNLLGLALVEHQQDKQDGFLSMTTQKGHKLSLIWIRAFLLLYILGLGFAFLSNMEILPLAILSLILMLSLLPHFLKNRMEKHDLYRVLGDLGFSLGFLVLV